jgi:phage/plasmid-associated DNA primase
MSGNAQPLKPLEHLTSLFGEGAFLVPCHWGSKKPIVTYVERPFEGTKSPVYLDLLNAPDTNIALYLGKASAGLCALDFDVEEDFAVFLALNSKLAQTTRVRGYKGAKLIVRLIGDYPNSCKTAHFEWRATGNLAVVYGRHPAGMDYQFQIDAAPVALSFEEIVWPEQWEKPWQSDWEPELRQLYGEPFYKNKGGKLTNINEAFWAGLHAKENHLIHEPDEQAFYLYNPQTGLYEIESSDAIRCKMSARILEASRQANVFELQKRRGAPTLNNIIAHLRGIVEKRHAFAKDAGTIHVANGVIIFSGGNAEFQPFSPHLRSRNGSPMRFNENAVCERFLNELLKPALQQDDIELLQKFLGMCLLGYNRAQRILILDGEGGTGKTQVANVVQGVVGMANVTQLRTKFLGERFELFRYLKRTLLVGVDVEPNFLSTPGAAHLKGLVGGDWLDLEKKGGTGSFQVQGIYNVVITSNARLRVRLQGDVGAWLRRLLIVRFNPVVPKVKIPDFGNLLLKIEGEGILNWGLMGVQKLLSDIPDGGGDLLLSDPQKLLVESLLAESDSVRHFLLDCVVTDASENVTVQELVLAYGAYCPERKWRPLPVTEVYCQLEALMLELFGVPKRNDIGRYDKVQRGFGGVRLQ